MSPRSIRALLATLLALEIALLVFGPQSADHMPAIQSATAAGKRPDWWDDAAMGMRYAAWINLGLLAVLLATAQLWTRPLPCPGPRTTNHEPQTPKWFWPALIAAAALCLALRLPLASKSLWWDEAWVILQASHGKWSPDKKHPGDLKFTAHDWKRCAWYYQKPTNHAPMSLLQKVSIGAWQNLTDAKRTEFNDLAARVPALLASMTAVLLLGCLLRAWGRPGAGVAAAFILAIHPWHIRYGVDARAYALVVPLCVSAMFALTRIAECGGRRPGPWIWFGATEFLWLWAFPNAVFDISALNIVAAVLLWRSYALAPDRRTAILRLAATNAFAAILFIQMFLPNLMQARHWAGQEADRHVLDLALLADTAASLLSGQSVAHASLRLPVILGALAIASASFVIVWAQRRSLSPGIPTLPALAAAAVLFAGVTSIMETYYYPRFAIALLPVLVAALCLAFPAIGRFACSLPSPMLPATVLVILGISWATPIFNHLNLPIAPLHDVARFVKTEAAKDPRPPVIACYGLGREVMPVYEPRCLPLETHGDVAAVMQRAKSEQRGLFVIYGYSNFNRTMLPDGFALLDEKRLFEEVKVFAGIEPDFHFRVLRMTAN